MGASSSVFAAAAVVFDPTLDVVETGNAVSSAATMGTSLTTSVATAWSALKEHVLDGLANSAKRMVIASLVKDTVN
jgi:hypothetical protein